MGAWLRLTENKLRKNFGYFPLENQNMIVANIGFGFLLINPFVQGRHPLDEVVFRKSLSDKSRRLF